MTTQIYKNGKPFYSLKWDSNELAELYGEYFVSIKQKQEPGNSWAWITE